MLHGKRRGVDFSSKLNHQIALCALEGPALPWMDIRLKTNETMNRCRFQRFAQSSWISDVLFLKHALFALTWITLLGELLAYHRGIPNKLS